MNQSLNLLGDQYHLLMKKRTLVLLVLHCHSLVPCPLLLWLGDCLDHCNVHTKQKTSKHLYKTSKHSVPATDHIKALSNNKHHYSPLWSQYIKAFHAYHRPHQSLTVIHCHPHRRHHLRHQPENPVAPC